MPDNAYIARYMQFHPLKGLISKPRGRVGRKGELFPPKSIREKAGLKPGDEVTFEVIETGIKVQKIPTLKEAFAQKKFAKISFQKFEEMSSEVLRT